MRENYDKIIDMYIATNGKMPLNIMEQICVYSQRLVNEVIALAENDNENEDLANNRELEYRAEWFRLEELNSDNFICR